MSTLREDLEIGPADTQKAYDEAGRYEFMGRRLEPWTVRRHSVALQLRSRLMRGMDDENNSVSTFLSDGFYPHVYHDLVVVLYLLHLDKKQVIELEQLATIEALDRAYDWAESIPLTYGSAPFFEATKILGKLLHAMHVSWFQMKKKESDSGENGEKKISTGDIERPGNSSSLPVQSEPAVTTPITF